MSPGDQTTYIGGLPFDLNNVNDQIKIMKLKRQWPELVPADVYNKISRINAAKREETPTPKK